MYQHKAHPQSEAHWVSLFLDEHSEKVVVWNAEAVSTLHHDSADHLHFCADESVFNSN